MEWTKLLKRKSLLVGAASIAVISIVALPLANAAITTKPPSFKASCGTGSCTLSWGGVSGATGYVVAYGLTSGSQQSKVSTTKTSLTVNNLNANTTYYWEVWATPASPGGPHSGPIAGKTAAVSSYPTVGSGGPWVTQAPGGFTATAGSDFIVLQWNSVPNATSYTVNYSTDTTYQRNTNTCVVVGNKAIVDTYHVANSNTTTRLQPNTTYNIELWGDPIQVDASPHAFISVKTQPAGSGGTEPPGQCGSGGSTVTTTSSTSSSSGSGSGGSVSGDAPSAPTSSSTSSSSSSTSSGSGTFVNDFGMTVSLPSASECAQIQAWLPSYSC